MLLMIYLRALVGRKGRAVRAPALLVAAGVTLAACAASGASQIKDSDPAAHRAAVEAQIGQPIADWGKYEAAMAGACGLSKDAFDMEVAQLADEGQLAAFEISVKYVCPKRSTEIDKALGGIAETRRACDVPAAARTQAQKDIAAALNCT